jgi:hypothetical protein
MNLNFPSSSPITRLAVLLALALGLLSLAACGKQSTEPTVAKAPNKQVVQDAFEGIENYDRVMNAPTVQVCRLHIDSASPPEIDGRAYREGPKFAVSAEQVARLRQILADPATYSFDSAKGCEPTYGVRFLFESEANPIALNLCFDCKILAFSREGKVVAGEDFENAESQLIALCKELFPDDAEIQRLK